MKGTIPWDTVRSSRGTEEERRELDRKVQERLPVKVALYREMVKLREKVFGKTAPEESAQSKAT